MPNAYYSPAPQNPIKAGYLPDQAQADAIASSNQAVGQVQKQTADDQAQAFQKHLDAGYTAMTETLKGVPPQIASTIPDPAAFSDSEDKRVAWYGMLNDAVAKNGLLDAAQDPAASPDALATQAARAPMSQESQKQVSGEIGRLDQRQQASAIQKAAGMFTDAPAAPAPAKFETPTIDPKTQMGRTLKIALTRMEPHADSIQNAATQANIPPQLIMAVASQESAGAGDATSKTGVKGTMQVTNGTFKDIAARYPELKLTDRTDPGQSYTAGGIYLGELAKQFGGDVEKTLAAYNAGPTAIRQAVAKYPDDWKDHLAEFVGKPEGMTVEEKAAETKDYIGRVGKFFTALGGPALSGAAAKKAPTQNEFNQALLKENPNAVINPIAKELKAGLKADSYIEANAKKADAAGAIQERLMQKFKLEQDAKTYQKINNYNKQIADLAAPVQSIARIGELLGGFDNTGDVPGVGLGSNTFKKFLMTSNTPEARDMRIAIGNMFTDIGFSEAGKNFTNKEMELVNNKLGIGELQDADTFRKAMKIQAQKFQQRLSNPWNALPDDVQKDMIEANTTNPYMLDVAYGPGTKPTGKAAASGDITTKSGKKFKIVKKD
jgi:soluble lytic murein transglycosylase-like protein